MFTLANFEAFMASHVTEAEDEVKAAFNKVRDWFASEEAKITAEIEHLVSHGYVVTSPDGPGPSVATDPMVTLGAAGVMPDPLVVAPVTLDVNGPITDQA